MDTIASLQAELAIVKARRTAANPELALYEALLADRLQAVEDEEREEATALLLAALRSDKWELG